LAENAAGRPRQTKVLKADEAAIREAAVLLKAGGLVAMPTETVYGLAADASNERAVAALYAAKGRPQFNPLIAHVASTGEAELEIVLDGMARRLAEEFWPGPLTIVAPVAQTCRVGLLARAGLQTLAVRMPAHAVAQALIAATGRPLVAPSANRSGSVSGTRADHVFADLNGRIDLILDAGPSPLGLESTIVACLGGAPRLLRPGALPAETIETFIGEPLGRGLHETGAPLAPGALGSHYAPRAKVRLKAKSVDPGEAGLDFGGAIEAAPRAPVLDLSKNGDLAEAAANLFVHLRTLDALNVAAIAVAPIPEVGLGVALNDRLRRAAADRPDSSSQK
jgi:L-threonylcarbamoyladenylate synthase